jgi:hypothetical protein
MATTVVGSPAVDAEHQSHARSPWSGMIFIRA